jgi:hypothetical protein
VRSSTRYVSDAPADQLDGSAREVRAPSLRPMVSEAEQKITRPRSRVPEYIVVLVAFNFRDLASAPKVRWRARAGALALGQAPKHVHWQFKASACALLVNRQTLR